MLLKQNLSSLSNSLQNQTVTVYNTNFSVGSSKNSNLVIKDQNISGTLCYIKLTKVLL